MLGVAIAAILLVGGFYYRTYGTLKRGQWQVLLALRALAIVIVVLLLFKPVFSFYKEQEELPGLVLLLDTSGSMSIADTGEGLTRFDLARQQVQQWCDDLKEVFNLQVIAFAEHAQRLEDLAQLMTLAPTGKATSLSRALEAGRAGIDGANLEAVILVSDGIHNSAGNPEQVALRMRVPVHTVGVGASLKSDASYRDVQLAGLDCPERMMLNNLAKVVASVEAAGLPGRVVSVLLEEDGQQLDQQELTLDAQEGTQEVTFEFRPKVKGRHTYTVRIPALGEEKIEQNNERSCVAMVVEPGIRVLYLEGTLRAEYGALVQRFLSKDPDLEFCALVRTHQNRFAQRTNIEGLQLGTIPSTKEQFDAFSVFIIGDLDSSYFRPEQQQMLVQRVRDGAGLLMLGGYHSLGPGGYAEGPLADVLPVFLGDRQIGQVTQQFVPVLTPDGVHHPIFANIADFFPTQTSEAKRAGLPPLLGCTRVQAQRPAATVLAVCLEEAAAMPVLAVQPVDQGRTAVFTGDTTRNWQQAPRVLGQESPFLQFWGQMVRWLAGRSDEVKAEASVVASTEKAYYEPEESVSVSAIVRDSEGQGTDKATVTAKIKGPAGRIDQVELSVVPGPGGHYSGLFDPKAAGAYEIVVEARVGELTVSSNTMAIEVGRPNLEFENLDLDEKRLGRIAAQTGGRCLHISTANQLINQLDRTARKKRIHMEKPLFWPPLFWLLFVGLVTVEWVLRRRFQLR